MQCLLLTNTCSVHVYRLLHATNTSVGPVILFYPMYRLGHLRCLPQMFAEGLTTFWIVWSCMYVASCSSPFSFCTGPNAATHPIDLVLLHTFKHTCGALPEMCAVWPPHFLKRLSSSVS